MALKEKPINVRGVDWEVEQHDKEGGGVLGGPGNG